MIKDLTLIFHLSPYHFSYLIINSEKNYITNNKTYAISDTKESTITKQLDNIIQKDILLQVKYTKTLGGLDLGHQTLIPDILFDQEKILPSFGKNQVSRCGPTEGISTKARFSSGMVILVKSKL